MTIAPPKMLRPANLEGLAAETDESVRVEDLLKIDERTGREIRNLRRARGLTLEALSKAAGLSKGHLSQIERGRSRPSVKALHAVSRALGVTISWFFPEHTEQDHDLRDFVVRSEGRRKLTFVGGISDELLSPNLGRQLELLRCAFPPGSESGKEPYTHQGEEAGIVISGQLNLWIDDRHVILGVGDSFAFESDIPHRYANHGDEICIVIWAITPPSY